MIDFLIQNKEWLFSGVGVAAVPFVWWLLRLRTNQANMSQKSGRNSTNLQAGGSINIKSTPDENDGH